MALKVVKDELLKTLQDAVDLFATTPFYKIGLFKNNWTPGPEDDITDVTPADFSGYAAVGLANLISWTTPVWVTPRAESTHGNVVWTHNGGATSNDIYGYYVVDEAGNLAWAERNATGPVTISVNGQTYTVTPKYTRRSEF